MHIFTFIDTKFSPIPIADIIQLLRWGENHLKFMSVHVYNFYNYEWVGDYTMFAISVSYCHKVK